MARLGGVLQVVLALWSRLGGRMGPFGADLEPEGGAIFLRGVRGAMRGWQGSALENRKKTTRQQTSILTRPYRAGTVADLWMHGCMDGWMDAWMYGCMDGCMDVWFYGYMDV